MDTSTAATTTPAFALQDQNSAQAILVKCYGQCKNPRDFLRQACKEALANQEQPGGCGHLAAALGEIRKLAEMWAEKHKGYFSVHSVPVFLACFDNAIEAVNAIETSITNPFQLREAQKQIAEALHEKLTGKKTALSLAHDRVNREHGHSPVVAHK